MKTRPKNHASVLFCAAACMLLGAAPAGAQDATKYEVRKGDMLLRIANKTKPSGITRDQMLAAIYAANESAFKGGNIDRLSVGTVLTLPSREEVAKTAAADARKKVSQLLAAAKPTLQLPTEPTAAGRPALRTPLTPQAAAERYQVGLDLERKGDFAGALTAFLEAGESGYGPAQKKLGQIYDAGNSHVKRDYQVSLKWYSKARAQGVEIDSPAQIRAPGASNFPAVAR
jgi:FimV-like protein